MRKITKKTLAIALAVPMLTTSALSQITISGYLEAAAIAGSTKGTLNTGTTKNLGADATITIAGKGKMTNGWEYSVSQNLQSDADRNGRTLGNSGHPLTTRSLVLNPSKDIGLFYTYDGVYGGEIARTTIPTVAERPVDFTGLSGLSEFIDVTSGHNAVGIDVRDVLPGRLSFAYNPNLDSTSQQSSDRTFGGAGQAASNTASGYSFGYRGAYGPITVGLGYTAIDQKHSATAQDVKSKTLGLIYTKAPFAVGVQRTINDGQKAATATTANVQDTTDSFSATFAVNKEVSVGYILSRQDRKAVAQPASGPTTEVHHLMVAYNLGPVVVTGGYESADDKPATTGATANVSGLDNDTFKLKVKANF